MRRPVQQEPAAAESECGDFRDLWPMDEVTDPDAPGNEGERDDSIAPNEGAI